MTMSGEAPLPASATGVLDTQNQPERGLVRLMPVGEVRSRDRTYGVYDASHIIPGMLVRRKRVLRQKPAPIDVSRSTLREADLLSREAAYVDLFLKGVEAPVKRDYSQFTVVHPEIDGIESGPDHGNFSATVVSQPRTERDAEKIYRSLSPARREGVVERRPTITIVFDSAFLESKDGSRRSVAQVIETVRNALVADNITRKEAVRRVKRGFTYKVLDKKRIDEYIRGGVRVDGVSTTVSTRIEVDPVDTHRGINIRRPRRIRERLAKIRRERKEADASGEEVGSEVPVSPEYPGYASI